MNIKDDNTDDPNRHNVGGSMNRPPRNDDPHSPRNHKQIQRGSSQKPVQ